MVDELITSLYNLEKNCAFSDLMEEMIRDQTVVGILDAALSERLQLDADLTLEKAKIMVRQRVAVQKQQDLLEKEFKKEHAVEFVERSNSHKGNRQSFKTSGKPLPLSINGQQQHVPKGKCSHCGKGSHSRQ